MKNQFNRLYVLPLIAVAVLSIRPLQAQSCSNQDFDIGAALQISRIGCDPQAVYSVASVADKNAIPALQRLIASESGPKAHCGTQIKDAANIALAKLGEGSTFEKIASKFRAEENGNELPALTLIGDDRAMAVMLAYLSEHPKVNKIQSGDSIVPDGPQRLILRDIGKIGKRRTLPDLSAYLHSTLPEVYRKPGEYSEDDVIAAWKEWWEAHQGQRITVAPYESVSDPNLRCLARRVDWGFEGAILAIADSGKPGAKAVLKKFPAPYNAGVPTMAGNLFLALAKLGDTEKKEEILNEWQHGNFDDAMEKTAFLGGKEAVDTFLAQLDSLSTRIDHAKEDCIENTERNPNLHFSSHEQAARYSEKWCMRHYEEFISDYGKDQAGILMELARMVKNPPLPASASPTRENIEKWKTWWQANRETAQLSSVEPAGSQN